MKIKLSLEHNNRKAILHEMTPATESKPDFQLTQNTPNPFGEKTMIRFSVPRLCRVKLTVLNKEKKLVRALFNDEAVAGWHEVTWFGDNEEGIAVPDGAYQYRLQTEGFVATRKLAVKRN